MTACIACHTDPDDGFDIVGLAAMRSLPPEWPLFYEDAFDLDGNGIAGRVRHVAGHGVDAGRPFVALYGRHLAAARLEDFALIAGAAHDIDLSDAAALDAVIDAFLRQSPDPMPPDPAILARFEARGCGGCHVTDAFAHEGRHYRPLSDFLLHDLGDGPVRTAPLWGCADCLEAPGHSATLRE
ncbi:MAG: hypothetical protein AAF264_01645 [Pseudomonadota bacterium]